MIRKALVSAAAVLAVVTLASAPAHADESPFSHAQCGAVAAEDNLSDVMAKLPGALPYDVQVVPRPVECAENPE